MEYDTKLSLFVIIVGIISSIFVFSPIIEAAIPPTPAIKMINMTGGNVTATSYNDFVEFIAGLGMTIVPNFNTHEITFSTVSAGGNVIGEGVQGRLAIWNDTAMINSTALGLAWDWNTNTLNIANGHFFNATYYNIGTNKITGSMTCINGQVLQYNSVTNVWECLTLSASGEINTASNVGTDTGIFRSKTGVDLAFKSLRAGSNIAFTSYPNEILINATGLGTGNATVLNDLGDVIITASAIDHILQSDGTTYNNKLFKADSDLNTTGTNNITFLTGFDNSTGDWTRKIFQASTLTCAGGSGFSAFDNQTGVYTCTAFGGGGEANTASNIGTDTGIFKSKVGVDLQFKSIRAGANVTFTSYPNEILINSTCTTCGIGNATVLDNLGDVIITSSAYGHHLVHDGTTYVNKLFKVNNNTNTTSTNNESFLTGFDNQTGDFTRKKFLDNTDLNTTGTNNVTFLTGFDNQTGNYTRKIFQAATTTCSGTDKVSSYNNQTGVVTCTADAGGSGIPKPPQKKWGMWLPVSTTTTLDGTGLLAGTLTQDGTETFGYNTTEKSNAMSSVSGVVAGNNAGIDWLATNNDVFRGDQNSYLYAKFMTNETTSNRLFIGFHTGGAVPQNNDIMLTGLSGVGLCVNTTSLVYNFCHNAAGTTNDKTFSVTETAWVTHYVEIYTTDSGVTWCGKMDGGTAICSVTNIPAATTRMFLGLDGETSTASGTIFQYYHVYVENDK